MMELTKERLQQIVHAVGLEPWDYEEVFDGITTGEIVMMARQLLAGMEQETVAYIIQDSEMRSHGNPGFLSYDRSISEEDINEYEISITPLYAAPQLPQPEVVPDEIPRLPDGKKFKYVMNGIRFSSNYANGWNACRAAMLQGGNHTEQYLEMVDHSGNATEKVIMLQGAEPVSQPYALPGNSFTNKELEGMSHGDNPQANAYRELLAYRISASGWIPCSERMPNFDTRVLLHFPDYGGHIEDGCIGDEGDGPYHYFFDGDSLRHEPTHWQPLPAAPQQEVK